MFQTDPQFDPLVEILRLAYRRGCALRDQGTKETDEAGNTHPDKMPIKQKKSAPLSIMDVKKPTVDDGNVR